MSRSDPSSRPPTALRALRVNTAELLRQPGLRREIKTELDVAVFDLDPRLTTASDAGHGGPVRIDFVVESTLQGVRVVGSVGLERTGECRRCLGLVHWTGRVEADELYQEQVTDPEAIEIDTDVLDLAPLVRDLTILALADESPLCRDECAGLCPQCGVDRNLERCSCDVEIRDQRWSALDQLVLGDPAAPDPEAPDDGPREPGLDD
jgi:uncharacterized protein